MTAKQVHLKLTAESSCLVFSFGTLYKTILNRTSEIYSSPNKTEQEFCYFNTGLNIFHCLVQWEHMWQRCDTNFL